MIRSIEIISEKGRIGVMVLGHGYTLGSLGSFIKTPILEPPPPGIVIDLKYLVGWSFKIFPGDSIIQPRLRTTR